MSAWDPRIVEKAIQIQTLMMDQQKERRVDQPPAIEPTIQSHVPPTGSVDRSVISRTYEHLNDPPITVLKFKNSETGEVEMQIPSEVSVRIYKRMLDFFNKINKRVDN